LENLFSLFFELSNEDRLKILEQLNSKAMNTTNLSRKLNLSLQETSRHIHRLHKIGLVRKDTDLYHVAPYGELILKHLKALRFLSRHSDYFNSHTPTRLPEEFVGRVGDLAECRYEDDSVLIWNNVQNILEEAKHHVWSLTHQYDVASLYMIPRALSRGVKVMSIDRIDQVDPDDTDILATIVRENLQTVLGARKTGQLEERLLERIDMFLWISDKEAVLVFPANDGKFDYQGFVCKDENSLTWCRDLFQHYWERARTLKSVIDELSRWVMKRTGALRVLRKVATETKGTQGEELIPELQQKGLMVDGKLTWIGLWIYEMLQR
jgi:predicted transcriptional regulator